MLHRLHITTKLFSIPCVTCPSTTLHFLFQFSTTYTPFHLPALLHLSISSQHSTINPKHFSIYPSPCPSLTTPYVTTKHLWTPSSTFRISLRSNINQKTLLHLHHRSKHPFTPTSTSPPPCTSPSPLSTAPAPPPSTHHTSITPLSPQAPSAAPPPSPTQLQRPISAVVPCRRALRGKTGIRWLFPAIFGPQSCGPR